MNLVRVCFITVVMLTNFLYAQIEIPLIPENLSADDEYGATALSDNFAVIGAHFSDIEGTDAGAVYVYKLKSAIWIPDAILIAEDAKPGDDFGRFVNIFDNRIIIGALFADVHGENSGAAYIFKNESGVWSQEAKLIPSIGKADDQFGRSVDIYEDYAVVASRFFDVDGIEGAGAIFIYHLNGEIWVEEEIATINSPSYNDELGNGGLSSWGDYFVVGTNAKHIDGTDWGASYVFKRDEKDWNQVANLRPYGAYDNFGCSPVIYEDKIIVGSYRNNVPIYRNGAAYIFNKYSDSIWLQETRLIPSDATDGKNFGFRVSMYGNTVVVGAIGDNEQESNSGAAYVFQYNGTEWVETYKIKPDEINRKEKFGYYVSATEKNFLIGAPWKLVDGESTGGAYIYSDQVSHYSDEIEISSRFNLHQNYPNPFNPSTTISFELPFTAQINLSLYSITGEILQVISDDTYITGRYQIELSMDNFATGVYLYTIIARAKNGEIFKQSRKMTLLK